LAETTHGHRPWADPEGGDGAYCLLVVGPGLLRSYPLPARGAATIGREPTCEVAISDRSVSRRHARLALGPTCSIEDLGSRNGTAVRGATLGRGEVAAIGVGESFHVGGFLLVLVPQRAAAGPGPSSMVVDDPAPADPPPLLTTVARSPLTVLIAGETGVGKEVLAETLHRLSGRKGPLLRLNCASFRDELLESELFGHERGAFTGAVAAKPGLLEQAAGGTVFLDEIGELPAPLQPRLLRAIDAHEVLRVGGTRPASIDVRFLAATNRDLPSEVARGGFRLDLYYRLAVVTLSIPPLRERSARLPALARDLLAAAARRAGVTPPELGSAALARLLAHRWPGNVRELRNTLERALLLAGGGELRPEHLIFDAAPPAAAPAPAAPAPDDDERRRIVDALEAASGNQTRAAKLLGISRATLVTKLAIHRIPRPRAR
jgi:DNA-binding NtrC family response regulator